MKLMGAPQLYELTQGLTPAARGACAALRVELEAGTWGSEAEVSLAFPRAEWLGGRLIIALDAQICVLVAFNYRSGIALIETAGLCAALRNAATVKRRRYRS